ncbi:TPA: 3-methyl-2-oxobutanoate dehydrogenase subunit beta, partial [Clostridioides difficile]|nr:3-methyl-2-oxobutanoate dehydrogenase subunit beta [Clostridioides difficile]
MKKMWKGNHAIAEAALRGGCEFYAGYPITPQTEVMEFLSHRMSELGRTFIQSEN